MTKKFNQICIPVLDKGYVRYIDHMGSDLRICETARISYNSPSKGEEQDKKLLFYLWKNRHTSPFEQCLITFNIKLPLFVQGQMVRHRTQKLNQMSARYTEMKDEFYIPTKWRKQDTKNKQGSIITDENWNPIIKHPDFVWNDTTAEEALRDACEKAYSIYQVLIKSGIAREMARMVLPQNLYTEIYTTWDLHNLLHFLTLRLDAHAQLEIQEYAKAMYSITKQLFPWVIEAFDKYKLKMIEINENN